MTVICDQGFQTEHRWAVRISHIYAKLRIVVKVCKYPLQIDARSPAPSAGRPPLFVMCINQLIYAPS